MSTLLVVVHVMACVILVLAVLVQAGKDGGLGLMSSGSSQTVFGSSGGANFFTKFTAVVATVFMVTSITLTVTKTGRKKSLFDGMPAATSSAPSIPVPGTTTAPATAPSGAAAKTTAAPATAPAHTTAPAAAKKAAH